MTKFRKTVQLGNSTVVGLLVVGFLFVTCDLYIGTGEDRVCHSDIRPFLPPDTGYKTDLSEFEGCRIIEGELGIGGLYQPLARRYKPVDLTPLKSLREVRGELTFASGIISFAPMANLEVVSKLLIFSNPGTSDYESFRSLREAGDLRFKIERAEALNFPVLEKVRSLKIPFYRATSTVAGLNSVNDIGPIAIGGSGVRVLNMLNSVEKVDSLLVSWTNNLRELSGFEALSTIDTDLYVSENTALVDISGLNSLQTVGGNLTITGNTILPSTAVNNLLERVDVKGAITIYGNGP